MRSTAKRGAACALAVALAVLSACGGGSSPGAPDAAGDKLQSCTKDEECPLGQVCSLGYCTASGVDASADQAGPARMLVDPVLLDFGNPYLGGEYQRSFTISNTGGSTLNVTGLNLVEDHTLGAFSMTQVDIPAPLAPGETLTVAVTLRPNDANIPTGSVKVHSDDPDTATRDVTVDLVSHSKGSAALGVCAMNPTPPPDCVVSGDGNPVVDYGVVLYGAVVERVVSLTNTGDGNLPIGVTEISLTDPAHFTVTLTQVVDDPANPGHRIEQPATLPMLLSTGDPTGSPPVPPTELRAHLAFDATGIDGDVPHVSLVVKDTLSATPTTVPIIGHIAGCKPTGDAGVPDGGVDIQTDPYNCGACGHVCTTAHGAPACVTGQCATGSCDAHWGDCNNLPGDGCETDLQTTTAHCGTCVTACVNPNGSTQCLAGVCTPSCAAGSRDCDGNPVNGCETDISGSVNHCGDCNTVCTNDHGSTACVLGQCSPSCGGGFASCDGSPVNGCEQQLNTLTHCAACNTACSRANATATCATGACAIASCNGGYGNCDNIDANGCEQQLNTLTHCAACNTPCARANATATCATGACAIASCNGGYGNCDNIDANGCEQQLNTLTHCAACNTPCARANAIASCGSGTCAIASCNGGYGNCDNNDANGCEQQLNTLAHCVACNTPCARNNATATCASGSCGISSCNGGYGNCDGIDANGCEQPLNTLAHCAACNTPCARANATATCGSGACAIASCNGGFGSCDGNDANGCEQQLNTLTHCGGCNTPCARNNATATCASGSCAISSCNAGYGNCDGNDANGCEQQLNTLAHCAACNTPCARNNATATCATGSCAISSCNVGYQNCDGIDANGCELNRDANPACGTSVVFMGTIDGDTGSSTVSASGSGEAWFRVTIREGNNLPQYLSAEVALASAAGVDFDLYVYCVSCGGTLIGSSQLAAGQTDIVYYRRDDAWGSDDTRDLIIEVRYYGATACGGWSLTVYGNVAVSSGNMC